MTIPSILTVFATLLFLFLERQFPGRPLPQVKGWYWRVLTINLVQLAVSLSVMRLWLPAFGTRSIFDLGNWGLPVIEGFAGWIVGTFVFYWWHRLRHCQGFWLVFHQIHHSPSRIETVTSFYKHPIEQLLDAILSAIIIFQILGCSLEAAYWYTFFAATGEYFYHANIRTYRWMRCFIQTPELHSVHHQLDYHKSNYPDLPIWDRLFGTYRDATDFVERCGFPTGAEEKLGKMLVFKDVYHA